jgi:Rrf2 family protein
MLKLTRKLEYALIALRHMQDQRDTFISAKEIAGIYLIPQALLAKILQQMTKLNYIKAAQGPQGGYRIRKGLTEISLTQFVEEIEGPFGMVDCSISSDCLQLSNCNIRMPINKINDNIRSIFNDIPITDITN